MRVSLRCWLWLMVATLGGNLFAQSNSSIRPVDLVAAQAAAIHQETPKRFIQVDNSRSYDDLELEVYESFTVPAEEREAFRHEAPAAVALEIPQAGGAPLTLELVRVELPAFTVIESGTMAPMEVEQAVHYRGIVAGEPESLVSLSVWDGEMAGLISSPSRGGNLVLGRLPQDQGRNTGPDDYILYHDRGVFQSETFSCQTPDSGIGYTVEELRPREETGRGPGDCVRVYLEVDHDIYQNKGGTTNTTQYITSLFNQVATLYANDQISIVLSEMFIWSTPSPYNGATSGDMLNQFQSIRTNFNGDVGQLLSFQASGGIAVVDGLCHPYTLAKLSYSGISSSFNTVPTYSWSVMVIAHELGHLLGSQHTHACVWNGNNTAIDGCPGYTEGGCGNPGTPSNGGTIMSYCHLNQVGINFSNGFGAQPGALMRNRITAATCLTTCNTGGGGSGGGGGGGGGSGNNGDDNPPVPSCAQQELIVRIKLDTYTPETTWLLKNQQNSIVAQGGPYPKTQAGEVVLDTLCLPEGCYSFQIMDSYGDGICCDYGDGLYLLVDGQQQVIAEGGEFPSSEEVDFCLPNEPGGDDCQGIDFSSYNIVSYGTNQDAGQYEVQDDGLTLYMENNAWKSIALDYQVTQNTVVAFDFKSTRQGEIHGLGFDANNSISYSYTMKVHGTQSWGNQTFDSYQGGGIWQSFTIPIGQYYNGYFDRLFFVSDHDAGARNGNSWFRNVRIYEGSDCMSGLEEPSTQNLEVGPTNLQVFPNPVTYDQLRLTVDTPVPGDASWTILSLTGQVLRRQATSAVIGRTQETINTSGLPPGAYLLRWRDASGEQTARFTVQ